MQRKGEVTRQLPALSLLVCRARLGGFVFGERISGHRGEKSRAREINLGGDSGCCRTQLGGDGAHECDLKLAIECPME
jgi:hypothetical protein